MIMSVKLYQCLALLLIISQLGCYPKGAEYAEELDLVYTNYMKDYDFKSHTTYAIPDSVIVITGDNLVDPDGDHKPQVLSSAYSTVILAQLNQNLQAYGWTKVAKTANPDVLILPSTMTTTNIYYYYDWGYWGWWYGGWYGWYYPGYYPPYITGYRSGSVFVQMVQKKAIAEGENLPVVWHAILNGLAEGSSANISARIQNGLNKAFSQSTYLKH
jgi:hypothetical protein